VTDIKKDKLSKNNMIQFEFKGGSNHASEHTAKESALQAHLGDVPDE
jgi:hypothetical protein